MCAQYSVVVIYVVLVSLYLLSLAGHLSERRTLIYYCNSIRLCIGGQAALASAGTIVFFLLICYVKNVSTSL